MRNIKHYDLDSFEFYKDVINRKYNTEDDPDFKKRLSHIYGEVESLYDKYETNFKNNTLELMNNFGYSGGQKKDLLSLYSFSATIFQLLKIKLTTTDNNRVSNTCQNCSISEISSFDHLLPKEEFPEYAVNPKNLFPSCTKCNSYKSVVWRNSSKRLFLNLYLDILPVEQYLFVNIAITSKTIDIDFYLDNKNGIDADLFELISSHYNRLHLLRRFRGNSHDVITSLKNSLSPYVTMMSVSELSESALETCKSECASFGNNYWQYVLKLGLILDTDFIQQLYS